MTAAVRNNNVRFLVFVLGLIDALLLLVQLSVPTIWEIGPAAFAAGGFVCAQFSVLMIWLVVGPGRLAERLPFVLVAQIAGTIGWSRTTLGLDMLATIEGAVLLWMAPLRAVGLRAVWADELADESTSHGPPQFSVKEMLLGVAAIGVLLALGQVDYSQHGALADFVEGTVICIWLATSTLIAAWIAGANRFLPPRALALIAVCAWLGSALVRAGGAPRSFGESIFLALQIAFAFHLLFVAALLGLLRACGLRFIWLRRFPQCSN